MRFDKPNRWLTSGGAGPMGYGLPAAIGAQIAHPFGADEGISIKRALLNRFTENSGFSGSKRRVTYTYGLTVKNNKSTTETIMVKDHFSGSCHERIVVKLLTPSNDDIKRDAESGFTQRWELASGATREATLKFSIDYPGDMAVTGLNQRQFACMPVVVSGVRQALVWHHNASIDSHSARYAPGLCVPCVWALSRDYQGILIMLEYAQEQMAGPPFSVPDSEVQILYTPHSDALVIDRRDILDKEPKLIERGLSALTTVVYCLQGKVKAHA